MAPWKMALLSAGVAKLLGVSVIGAVAMGISTALWEKGLSELPVIRRLGLGALHGVTYFF
jgi:hypothetical protein